MLKKSAANKEEIGMLKGFFSFLLFAAVFFMGMYAAAGGLKTETPRVETAAPAQQPVDKNVTQSKTVPNIQQPEAVPVFAETAVNTEEHLTNKTASFLGGIVSAFYDLIVGILYSIANVLF